VAKRKWCCRHEDLGCAPTSTMSPASITSSPAFDCQSGLSNWANGWSKAKAKWCCRNEGRGCPAPFPAARPASRSSDATAASSTRETHQSSAGHFDCDAGYKNSKLGWSERKKLFCCGTRGITCPDTTSQPFDCQAGHNNLVMGLSSAKQVYCCQNYGLGCPSTSTTTSPFDCRVQYYWGAGWSRAKQEWCCLNEGRGCPSTSTTKASPSYDCEAGFVNWSRGWSPAKIEWCCMHEGRACPSTSTVTATYDCEAGLVNWSRGWSPAKIEWCCTREGHACPSTSPSMSTSKDLHDVAAYVADRVVLRTSTSTSTSTSTTTSALFDCQAGYARWATGWSRAKKNWCCVHEGLGCRSWWPPAWLVVTGRFFAKAATWFWSLLVGEAARIPEPLGLVFLVAILAVALCAWLVVRSRGGKHEYSRLRQDWDSAVARASHPQAAWLWGGPCWPQRQRHAWSPVDQFWRESQRSVRL